MSRDYQGGVSGGEGAPSTLRFSVTSKFAARQPCLILHPYHGDCGIAGGVSDRKVLSPPLARLGIGGRFVSCLEWEYARVECAAYSVGVHEVSFPPTLVAGEAILDPSVGYGPKTGTSLTVPNEDSRPCGYSKSH